MRPVKKYNEGGKLSNKEFRQNERFQRKSEKEKKVSQQMLIAADDLREAYDRLHTNLSEFLAEFR